MSEKFIQTGWDLSVVLGEVVGFFLIILAEPDSEIYFLSSFCLGPCRLSFVVNFGCQPPASWLTTWESHRLTWMTTSVWTLSPPSPRLKLASAPISLAKTAATQYPCYVGPAGCHPLAPDTAQLPTGPAPHIGPASLGTGRIPKNIYPS